MKQMTSRFSRFIRISNTYNCYIVGAQDTQRLADHGIAMSRPSNSFESAKSFVVKCPTLNRLIKMSEKRLRLEPL